MTSPPPVAPPPRSRGSSADRPARGNRDFIATALRTEPLFRIAWEKEDPAVAVAAILEENELPQRLIGHLVTAIFNLQKAGRTAEALKLAQVQLGLARSRPEDEVRSFMAHTQPRNVADALQSIGEIHHEAGDSSYSLEVLLEAEAELDNDERLRTAHGIEGPSEFDRLFSPMGPRHGLYERIASVYRVLGDADKAAEYRRKASGSREGADTPEGRLQMWFGRMAGAQRSGDYDLALHAGWEVLEAAEEAGRGTVSTRHQAEASVRMGDLLFDLELYRTALESYERAAALNRASGHHGRLLWDLGRIGRVHEATGDLQRAAATLRESLRACSIPLAGEAAGSVAWQDEGGEWYKVARLLEAWPIFRRLGLVERARGNLAGAEAELARAVDVLERLRTRVVADEHRIGFQPAGMEAYESVIDVLAERWQAERQPGHLDAMLGYVERAKSRVLVEQLADTPLPRPATIPDDLLTAEARVLGDLTEVEAKLTGEVANADALATRRDQAQAELEEIWTGIAAADPERGPEYVSLRRAEPMSVAGARVMMTELAPVSAIVEYYALPDRLLVLTMRSDRLTVDLTEVPVGRQELRDLAAVNPEAPPALDLRLPYWHLDLGPLLVAPVWDAAEASDLVYLVPHDVLHGLPVHALRPAEHERRALVDVTSVAYVPSLSLLRYCLRKPPRDHRHDFVAGDPSAEHPLTYARAEVAEVARILGSDAFAGERVTADLLREMTPAARYVHLACHAEFDADDALTSALLLGDGPLTARDLLGFDVGADLVTLSACKTGVSETRGGDELIGLVRSLLFAGSPSVVVSQWNAYDEATSAVMTGFYERLVAGEAKAHALAATQRRLKGDGMPDAHWAPFVLIGSWA